MILAQRHYTIAKFLSSIPHVLYVLIVILGVLLRLYNIGIEFHQDEVFSVQAASSSFAHLIQVAVQDSTHTPLHLVLLHLWIRLWGTSEIAVRALSVLASGLFLLLLYRLALRWMGVLSALIVLLLCAVSPFFVYYGQWARPYALVPLWITLSIYLLYKSQDELSNSLYKVLYGVSCAAVVYTQYLGVFLLVPQFVALALSRPRAQRTLLLYGLGGMSSIIPWMLLSLGHNFHRQGLEERIGWLESPTLFNLVSFFVHTLGPLPIRGSTSVFMLLSALVIFPIGIQSEHRVRRQFFLLVSLAFFGPIVAFLISRYSSLSIWSSRQLVGPALFFVVLLGFCINLHHQWLRGILASLLVVWCIAALPAELSQNRQPPWRAIVNLIQQNCPNCDVVVQGGWIFVDPLRYYLHREVHRVQDYTRRLDKTKPVVFVCRPVSCDGLNNIEQHAKMVASQSMYWKTRATPYTTIHMYFFTPRSSHEG